MLIKTKYLGDVEIEQEKIIQFPEGLPGFQDEKMFVLLNIPGNEMFQALQSICTPMLAFIITNPYQFYKDYTFDLVPSIVEKLHIQKPEDVAVYTIVTIKDPFHNSTINLKAPLIIHSKNKQGKQYILSKEEYSAKAPIAPTKSKVRKERKEC
ncbi:flagellar assembly protein FliW [Virgibacillus sp. W0430]|uniref:flagellar assembly protein FliW n=1 Tax=Virgibacillus sp. W0430 TaxID=3391580 RepID=UPI003F44B289